MLTSVDTAAPAAKGACAFAGCARDAFLKVRRPGSGYVNVCREHYETLAARDAAAWCAQHGVNSAAEARAFLRWKLPTLSKNQPGVGWARRILERAAAGEAMPMIAIQKARLALGMEEHEQLPAREPGVDERESDKGSAP